MSDGVAIRPGTESDLPALNAIYAHYVATPATFATEPMSMDAWRVWFEVFGPAGPHRLFVAVEGAGVIGYASSRPFRSRSAYRTSVETSVYCHPEACGRGLGTTLYGRLFQEIAGEGLHRAFAGVTMPNDASVALHRKFGFTEVGTFHEAGYKLGRYWDVRWFEKPL